MSYTVEQYQTLCSAIAKGVTSLEQNGEKVTYRSLAEMRQIKREMEQGLGLVPSPRTHYPAFRKG
ncbi:hypothetical protein CN97_12705 [Haematobacter massiliensis]|uniref:Uncharacterized protein n=1 Tax=Haematobacter massiliensis TaxID=195105 RepID=A0A086Y824_9RHOB|nr:hypothetical protein [Haematobacter massiliensis]KFI30424.1 hypothetical protein CN97_12705 [Haematobacter massiliensis]QBJ25394.1 hypothetical protein HmaOT1_11920 [Haematobacter massiliensis]